MRVQFDTMDRTDMTHHIGISAVRREVRGTLALPVVYALALATALAALLAPKWAIGAEGYCSLAGHYSGTYVGNTDRGMIDATVARTDGTVRGVAVSRDGRQIPLGGVAMLNGSFSAGSVATGAQFVGKFLTNVDGSVTGYGNWALADNQGGQWQIERDAVTADCQ